MALRVAAVNGFEVTHSATLTTAIETLAPAMEPPVDSPAGIDGRGTLRLWLQPMIPKSRRCSPPSANCLKDCVARYEAVVPRVGSSLLHASSDRVWSRQDGLARGPQSSAALCSSHHVADIGACGASLAGPRQSVPRRVLAPHLGANKGAPGGLPFFSHPRRGSWGLVSILRSPPRLTRSPSRTTNSPNYRLSASSDVDLLVLDLHALRPSSLQFQERQAAVLEDFEEARRRVDQSSLFDRGLVGGVLL